MHYDEQTAYSTAQCMYVNGTAAVSEQLISYVRGQFMTFHNRIKLAISMAIQAALWHRTFQWISECLISQQNEEKQNSGLLQRH